MINISRCSGLMMGDWLRPFEQRYFTHITDSWMASFCTLVHYIGKFDDHQDIQFAQ